jgi:hypothetical protein
MRARVDQCWLALKRSIHWPFIMLATLALIGSFEPGVYPLVPAEINFVQRVVAGCRTLPLRTSPAERLGPRTGRAFTPIDFR